MTKQNKNKITTEIKIKNSDFVEFLYGLQLVV